MCKQKCKYTKMVVENFISFLLGWLTAMFFFGMTSCRSIKPTVVVQTRDSVRIQYVEKVDSVWRDRYHTILQKGDTIFVRDSVWLYQYKYLTKTDSIVRRDSIPYEVQVVTEVRKRNWYDRATSAGFWILVLLLLGRIAWRIFKKYYLLR